MLVNNAGVGLVRSVDELTEADFDLTIAVNLKSVFLCTQAVIPGMRARQWGRIVNISSGAARGAGGVGPHYNASKAGMEGMTRGYAARLVKDGITVNAVAPSLIETDMVSGRRLVAGAHPARPLRHAGGMRADRHDAGPQRLHDRPDGGAERRALLRLMLRILGKASSINVRKVLWTCEEIGIAHTRADDGPELKQNPNGLVPMIVDGDFVLWESNSIIRYLANKWTAEALLPAEPQARAEVDRWIDWQATEFNSAWRYAFSAIVRKNPAFHDAREIEASKQQWTRMVAILDGQLARTGGHVAGAAFTLADIPIGLSVNRWFMTPFERPSFVHVEAYYERLSTRPAFRKHGRNGIESDDAHRTAARAVGPSRHRRRACRDPDAGRCRRLRAAGFGAGRPVSCCACRPGSIRRRSRAIARPRC